MRERGPAGKKLDQNAWSNDSSAYVALDDGLRPLFEPVRNFVVPTLHQFWCSSAFGQKQLVDRHRGRGFKRRMQAVKVDIDQIRQRQIREPTLEIANLLHRTFAQGVKNLFLAFEVGVDACLVQARTFRQGLLRHNVVCPTREFDKGRVEYFPLSWRQRTGSGSCWARHFLGWHSWKRGRVRFRRLLRHPDNFPHLVGVAQCIGEFPLRLRMQEQQCLAACNLVA